MNIINKVTLRHLRQNKRRSLVTIIGVIISVAMIAAVTTLGVSFLDLMVRQEISKNGEWHVQYKNVEKQQIEAIEKDGQTEKTILSSGGYAYLEGSQNDYKPYLYFQNYDEQGLAQFPMTVSEGRLPASEEEVAISEVIQDNIETPFQIGDQLTVAIGQRIHEMDEKVLTQNDSLQISDGQSFEKLDNLQTKTVTITGILDRPDWEPAWSPGYTVVGFIDKTKLEASETFDAFVVVSKLETELFDQAKTFADANGIEKVDFN